MFPEECSSEQQVKLLDHNSLHNRRAQFSSISMLLPMARCCYRFDTFSCHYQKLALHFEDCHRMELKLHKRRKLNNLIIWRSLEVNLFQIFVYLLNHYLFHNSRRHQFVANYSVAHSKFRLQRARKVSDRIVSYSNKCFKNLIWNYKAKLYLNSKLTWI